MNTGGSIGELAKMMGLVSNEMEWSQRQDPYHWDVKDHYGVTTMCDTRTELVRLLEDESDDLALVTGYERHGFPVPRELREKLEALKSKIECAFRAELDAKIAAEKRKIEELRSKEEKRQKAEDELEKLETLRDTRR